MLKIIVASKSALKVSAVEEITELFLEANGRAIGKTQFELKPMNTSFPGQCAQPFNLEGGNRACQDRIEWLFDNMEDIYDYDYVISIENYIETADKTDHVFIILHNISENKNMITSSSGIPLPDLDTNGKSKILESLMEDTQYYHELGATKTYGLMYHEQHPDVPADNWMAYSGDLANRCDRKEFIMEVLGRLMNEQLFYELSFLIDLRLKFHQYEDFPKKGVKFEDWNDIFLDPKFLEKLIEYLGEKYVLGNPIDYVMGLESRGYFLAVPLAINQKAGFVPIKKPGKTPGPTLTESYTKEYGTDTLELRADLKPGRVLIVDDVLATGGSLEAAIKLCERAGHTVVDALTIKDVPPLRSSARKKLEAHNVRVLLA